MDLLEVGEVILNAHRFVEARFDLLHVTNDRPGRQKIHETTLKKHCSTNLLKQTFFHVSIKALERNLSPVAPILDVGTILSHHRLHQFFDTEVSCVRHGLPAGGLWTLDSVLPWTRRDPSSSFGTVDAEAVAPLTQEDGDLERLSTAWTFQNPLHGREVQSVRVGGRRRGRRHV